MAHFQRLQTWRFIASSEYGGKTLQVPRPCKTDIAWQRMGFKSQLIELLRNSANVNQFVDVGANTGQTMLEVFSQNPAIEYFGFEPNPQAFSCLQQLALTLGINANLFPWACGTSSEPASFFASSPEDCSATLLPQIRPDTYAKCNPISIASYPLDISLKPHSISSCFIMKVDVEGFENEVLTGGAQVIKGKRPYILCEVLHAHRSSELGLNNSRKGLLESFLAETEYSIWQIELSPQDRNTLTGLKKISGFPKNVLWRDAPHMCDFLFAPKELAVPQFD